MGVLNEAAGTRVPPSTETLRAAERGFAPGPGRTGRLFSLPALAASGYPGIARLPRSIAILLESALRNGAAGTVPPEHVDALAAWRPRGERTAEVSFLVNRILLPDSTGIPLLADLAAMRSAARRKGFDAGRVEPRIRVDLVVDHSVQIDAFGSPAALGENMRLEMERNEERFRFIKWGASAFDRLKVVPPGVGICHQVNLERLAGVVWQDGDVWHPDLILGGDSHTPMVNGLGVLGWGVGGIEAEAAMLGQPTSILMPDVVGVVLKGRLPEGTTTTDLVLTVTERMRAAGVVGKFVEFLGEGAARLTVPERATLSNMAPEYGATVGYFPVDDNTLSYLRETGRDEALVQACEAYFKAQGLFGTPDEGEIDYTETVVVDLSNIVPSVAGPRRPQDRIALSDLKGTFSDLLAKPAADGGYGRATAAAVEAATADGDVVLAAITSCTNTSNPLVMVAAGLLARNAVAAGLTVSPSIKTSFSPGSRDVTRYLEANGLVEPLERLGFHVAAYGCGTCLGNSGPLDPVLEDDLVERGVVAAAVLSGNRNFEARVHPAIRANFLASPPLVVAFAIAGRVGIDFGIEPLGPGSDGAPVFLRDIWPDTAETAAIVAGVHDGKGGPTDPAPGPWDLIPQGRSEVYDWPDSTYVREPPFFADRDGAVPELSIRGARPLLILGDSVTTDHISPAGSIKPASDAGRYLREAGVAAADLNTFASRRGNHDVMVRGTFGNVRLRNRMVDGREGSLARHMPGGEVVSVFEAAERYRAEGVPLVVLAGREYGTGSSRDWAAKGPSLLGVRAVVARSFERIHRGNLIGLGILPCEFAEGDSVESLGLDGSELFDLVLPGTGVAPGCPVALTAWRADGSAVRATLRLRVDTATEADYLHEGGIMPYVLRRTLEAA